MKPPEILSEVSPKVLKEISRHISNLSKGNQNPQMSGAIKAYVENPGKMLRAAILYSTASAYGVDPELSLKSAAAIQMFQNEALAKDDIEDGSLIRRGEEALHIKYGIPRALNYADYIGGISLALLEENFSLLDYGRASRLYAAYVDMKLRVTEGQDMEMELRDKPLEYATIAQVLEILRKKSAYYTTLVPFNMGAITAGKDDNEIVSLINPALVIGIAFQLTDDKLNLVMKKEDVSGKPTTTGGTYSKDYKGDLPEGKRTLHLVELFKAADKSDKKFLEETIGNRDMDDATKDAITEMMNKYGIIEKLDNYANCLFEECIEPFKIRLPNTEGKKELLQLFEFAVKRSY